MDNLVEKERMQISETGLNKGFTLLEIIIVLTIISVASTSFYLLLRQPASEESLEDRINYFREISLYTGSTYAFSKESINIYGDNEWITLEDFNSNYVSSYEDINGSNKEIKKDEMYLIVAPGHEISAKKLILNNGEIIEFN